jgi:hypothetical protein
MTQSREALEDFREHQRRTVAILDIGGVGDCQDFRVWAGIMGKKESHYVPTQRACDP